MDVYVSIHTLGIYKITLSDNWTVSDTQVVFEMPLVLGLDYYKEHFYCVDATTRILYKLDRNWQLKNTVAVTNLDAHGVDCFDDKIVVTNPSGMHMEIYTQDLELVEHIPIPLYEKAIHKDVKRHHINSAQSNSAGEIYYTVTFMANNASYSHISRRDDGHIMKIVGNQHISVVSGLHLPHSLRIKDDHMYVCTKKRSCVEKYTLAGEFVSRTEPLDGWVRGLCPLDNGIWLVGLNCSRTDDIPISRSTVGIVVLKEHGNDWKVLNQFNSVRKEIFDIIRGPEL